MTIVFSDTGCDITKEMVEKYDMQVIFMPFSLDNNEYTKDGEISLTEFYKKIREGSKPSTSALNPVIYCEIFEPYLKDGHDIIYVHFSSHMSGSFAQLAVAIKELKEKYPDRTIATIDSLNISCGGGLLAFEVAKRNKEGMPFNELVTWAEQNKNQYSVYFYVDDLMHLKKGGRISATTAFFGSMLNIKPLLHCASCGELKIVGKAIGKKKAISELVNYAVKYGKDIEKHPIVILHADAKEEAEELRKQLLEKLGPNLNIFFDFVGTTVGTHCGPGTIGIFFHGEQLVID